MNVIDEFTKKAKEEEKKEVQEEKKVIKPEEEISSHIYAVRTTANREDQVIDFISSNVQRKKIPVYSIIYPHGMRGYVFLEAADKGSAELAILGVPYAKGVLKEEVAFKEIEHMLDLVKKEINIQKGDIAEIISGAFKRDKCKITRVDKIKGEVVVELLDSPVPIPITLSIDSVKVIRREDK